MKDHRLVLAAVVLLSTPAIAMEGKYRVDGTNLGSSQTYRGEALIKKTGATYSIIWQTGATRQVGTGLLTGSVLSVVFNTVGTNAPGVASFTVAADKVEGGRWTQLGATVTATERWTAE